RGLSSSAKGPMLLSCRALPILLFAVTAALAATGRASDPPAPAPKGNLSKARAHWISANTVAWKAAGLRPDWNVKLSYAVHGSLALGADGVGGGVSIPLTYDPAGLSDAQRALFPHLASYAAFHLPADRLSEVRAALEGQLAVSATDAGGASTDATGVQV